MREKYESYFDEGWQDMNEKPMIKIGVKIAIIGVTFFSLFALVFLFRLFSHDFRGLAEELLNPVRLWKIAWMPAYAAVALIHLFLLVPLVVKFNDAMLWNGQNENHDAIIMMEFFCVIGLVLGLIFGFALKLFLNLSAAQNVNLIKASLIASAVIFIFGEFLGIRKFSWSFGSFFGFWCASFFHYAAGFGICALTIGEKFSVWYMLSLFILMGLDIIADLIVVVVLKITKPSNY